MDRANKLETLLTDWLEEDIEHEYVQGMLALAGLLVIVVGDRDLRHAIFYILYYSYSFTFSFIICCAFTSTLLSFCFLHFTSSD